MTKTVTVPEEVLQSALNHLYELDYYWSTYNTSPDKWRRDKFSNLADLIKVIHAAIPGYKVPRPPV